MATSEKRPFKVFLCHAHADRGAVRTLYTRLTKDGVDAWLDKEKLLPGQDWELEIRKAVREADVVVVCLSKQFNQAGFRQKEVRLALDTAMEKPEGEIFIIPARLEECDNLENLRKWHWVDLFQDEGYDILIRTLQLQADAKVQIEVEIQAGQEAVKKKLDIETAAREKREQEDNLEAQLKAIEVAPQWHKGRKIISVHSTSGETGKLSIVANLVAQAALAGINVGVADMDFQSRSIHFLFGLDERKMGKTMFDFLHGRASIREVGVPIHANVGNTKGLSKLKDSQIWLFPSHNKGREAIQILREGVDFNKLNEGLQAVLTEFDLDCLFVNVPSNRNEETLLTIATSDVLVLISRLNDQDLIDTSVTIEIARSLNVPNLFLVVNKAPYKYDFAEIKKDIEAKLEVTVVGVLPLSLELESDNSSDLFSLHFPLDGWSKGLRSAAQAIFGIK